MEITYKEITTVENGETKKEQRIYIKVRDARYTTLTQDFEMTLADANLFNAKLGDVLADIPF